MSAAVWGERQSLPRATTWVAGFSCAVFATLVCLRLALQYAAAGALYLEDDAFYYTVIAHHIAQSGVSTFDGQTLTNGYHPLWLGLLVLQDLTVGGSIYVTIAIEIVLATAGVWFFLAAFRSRSLLLYIAFALAMAVIARPMIAKGMEVSLLVFALGLFTKIAVEAWEGRGNALALGFAAALCIGARIDSAVFVLPVLLLVSRGVRFAALAIVPLALAGLVFAAANLWIFSMPFPISGAIKSLGGAQINWRFLVQLRGAPDQGLLRELGGFANSAFGRCIVLGFLCAAALPFARRGDKSFPLLVAFIAGLALFFVKLAFFSSWQIWPWYAFPAAIGLVALFQVADDALVRRPVRVDARIELVVALALIAGAAFQLRAGASIVGPNFELLNREAAAQFAPVFKGERVAMGDRAGSFAAFNAGPVTQLEGLVNDRVWLDAMQNHRDIKPLLCERGVRYVLAYQKDLGAYATVTVPAMRPSLTSFDSPSLTFSRADEVGRVVDLAKYDNRPTGDEGDNYLYAWKLTGCPVK